MKKLFSIFLLLAVAFSSVGMSATQHFCTMSKEEIELSQCDMCSKEDHGVDEADEKSCCSNDTVHLRLDTDATSAKIFEPLSPYFAEALFTILFDSERPQVALPLQCNSHLVLQSFPLTEEHTVLRV